MEKEGRQHFLRCSSAFHFPDDLLTNKQALGRPSDLKDANHP